MKRVPYGWLAPALLVFAADVRAQETPQPEAETILVVGQRAQRSSSGATGLDLDIKDTPQSISVVTQEQMQRFGVDSVNDALRLATGIQVDEWETNRTTYSARGFDIKNTQIDGTGLPNDWGIVTGGMDAFGYEKLEVIRGANGLLTGVGNAAGTINYVRKRPTNDIQGSVSLSAGSWNKRRIEADYSAPIVADGRWAGRIVAAHERGDSYLRDLENERSFVYGVVDGQIGTRGTLTLGYSWQANNTDGNMWGALIFMNSDGTQNEWDTGASTTQDWTFWDTTTQTGFIEYTHALAADWQVKATYNYRRSDNDERLFYAWDPLGTGLDPQTGLGIYGYAWGGDDRSIAHLGTVTVGGPFEWLGRHHEAMLGLSWAQSDAPYRQYASADCGEDYPCYSIPMPAFPYPGDVVAEPVWGEPSVYTHLDQRVRRAFGATRLSLNARLKAVLGVNFAEYHRDGHNYDVAFDQTERELSPYAGLTFDFTRQVLGYVSYSDIYQPQDQADAQGRYLDPTKGVNFEAGLKADWLDRRLLTTLAWFSARQDGLATLADGLNEQGQTYYEPLDVESRGVEFEALGKLGEHLDLMLGFTHLKLTGSDGDDTYRWVPRRTVKLMLGAQMPGYSALSFGVGGRWQSATSNEESSGQIVRQPAYAVLNGFAALQLPADLTLRLNVNNLADEKYINTLRYSGFYGAPRNVLFSLNWQF